MTSPAARARLVVADPDTPARSRGRMALLIAVVIALVALLAGCTTGSVGGSDDTGAAAEVEREGQFPRTVAHAYGETEISEAPQRVATVSWVNADVSLALGVAPVGMPPGLPAS